MVLVAQTEDASVARKVAAGISRGFRFLTKAKGTRVYVEDIDLKSAGSIQKAAFAGGAGKVELRSA